MNCKTSYGVINHDGTSIFSLFPDLRGNNLPENGTKTLPRLTTITGLMQGTVRSVWASAGPRQQLYDIIQLLHLAETRYIFDCCLLRSEDLIPFIDAIKIEMPILEGNLIEIFFKPFYFLSFLQCRCN